MLKKFLAINKIVSVQHRERLLKIFLLLLITVCFTVSCSHFRRGEAAPKGAVLIDSRRKTPVDRQTVVIHVRYDDIKKAQSNTELNKMRVIPIVLSVAQSNGSAAPEYRLFFDNKKGGLFNLLGLQNADVLIAANGYVVFNPNQFLRYLASLPFNDGTFIEIIRNEKSLLLQYEVEGMPSSGNEAKIQEASQPQVVSEVVTPTPTIAEPAPVVETPKPQADAQFPSPTPALATSQETKKAEHKKSDKASDKKSSKKKKRKASSGD